MVMAALSSANSKWQARSLMIAAALILSPLVASEASAQVLGYASAPDYRGQDVRLFPQDTVTAPQSYDDEQGSGVADERFRRTVVNFATREAPGTIVVDTANTYLYYVLGQNRAIRYGVGVGREGFTWSGVQTVTRKAEWPDWHPPAEMIARQPYLPRFMAGGEGNPLGARAMYLGSSIYRIHGTNDPSTIGKFVSSGCIRLTNEDVADLFSRVNIGTKVVVLPKSGQQAPAEARNGSAPRAVSATPSRQPTTLGRQAMNLSASSTY